MLFSLTRHHSLIRMFLFSSEECRDPHTLTFQKKNTSTVAKKNIWCVITMAPHCVTWSIMTIPARNVYLSRSYYTFPFDKCLNWLTRASLSPHCLANSSWALLVVLLVLSPSSHFKTISYRQSLQRTYISCLKCIPWGNMHSLPLSNKSKQTTTRIDNNWTGDRNIFIQKCHRIVQKWVKSV